MSGGAAANKSGKLAERLAGEVLRHFGIEFIPQYRPKGITGVLENDLRIDFFIPWARGFEDGLYIEARWQDSSGSVDQKIPGLVMNITQRYDRRTILMIDGAETEKARNFAKDNIGPKLIGVMTLAEFVTFCKAMQTGDGEAFVQREFNPNQKTLWGVGA